MGYEGFELSSERVALDPIYHVAAVTCPKGDSAGGVDIRDVLFDVGESFFEIEVRTAAPLVFDSVLERHAVAGGTGGIPCYYDIAGFSEDEGIPAGGPGFIPCALGLVED